jgi:hypothetical protein
MQRRYCTHTMTDPTVSGDDECKKQLMQHTQHYAHEHTHVYWNSSSIYLSEQSLATSQFLRFLSHSEISIFSYRTHEKLLVGRILSTVQPIIPFWSYREENGYSDVRKQRFTCVYHAVNLSYWQWQTFYNNSEGYLLQTLIGLWIY